MSACVKCSLLSECAVTGAHLFLADGGNTDLSRFGCVPRSTPHPYSWALPSLMEISSTLPPHRRVLVSGTRVLVA